MDSSPVSGFLPEMPVKYHCPDANFSGDKSTAFSIMKMRKQGFIFFHALIEYALRNSVGGTAGNGVFSSSGWRFGDICVSTADEIIPAVLDSVACSMNTQAR